MPWHVSSDHPDCSGYAVVKDSDGEVEGCHETREAALRQLRALYAQEGRMSQDHKVIKRVVQAELSTSDGRTLDVRVVPYRQVARVSDDGGPPYDEEWLPGAFDRQLNAANRVLVNFEHERGLSNVVGHGVELRSTDEALDGTFRVLNGDDGDKALELVDQKVLTGISLEAVPLRSTRTADGVVQRVKARLINIALCRTPAFTGARVLAVREGDEPLDEEEEQPTPEETPEESVSEPDEQPDEQPVDEPSERSDVEEALARAGYTALVSRAITRRPWDGSASRFTDEQYQRSCLVCRDGDDSAKQRCSLPVLEPNGDLNANALGAAAAALAGARGGLAGVTGAQKAAAARKLIRYYRQAKMEPPQSLVTLAGR